MYSKANSKAFLYILLTFFLIIPVFNMAAADENAYYQMNFKVDGQSYILTEPGALGLIGYKDSKYIKEWYKKEMANYKGPLLFNGYSSEEVKALQLYASYSEAQLPYALLVLSYLPQRKEWVLQFNYFHNDYRLEATYTLESGRLPITIEGSDVFFQLNKKMEGLRVYNNGFTEHVKISALNYRGKIYGNSEVEGYNYGVFNWSNGSVFAKRGVSVKKQIRLDFAKVLFLTEKNLSRLASGAVIDPDRKIEMDRSINYFYLNGRKVFGEWNEEGTELVYTPSEPYPADSKVTIVIPESYSNIYGVKLDAPRFIYFYTGSSTVSTPYFYYTSFDNRGGEIKLGWEPLQNEEIDSYRIYRASALDGDYRLLTEITEESWNFLNGTYRDRNVEEGKVYYYKMQAVRGGVESGFSEPLIGKTMQPLKANLNEWGSYHLDRAAGEEQKYISFRVEKGGDYSLNLEKMGNKDIKVTVYYKDSEGLNFIDSSESPFTEPLTFRAPGTIIYLTVESLDESCNEAIPFKLILLED